MCRPSVEIPTTCRNPLAARSRARGAPSPRGTDQNVRPVPHRNPLGRRHRVGVLDGRGHAAFWYGGTAHARAAPIRFLLVPSLAPARHSGYGLLMLTLDSTSCGLLIGYDGLDRGKGASLH